MSSYFQLDDLDAFDFLNTANLNYGLNTDAWLPTTTSPVPFVDLAQDPPQVVDKKKKKKYHVYTSKLLFAECQMFSKKNDELRKQIAECQAEISLIKSLLIDALVKKNFGRI